MNEAYIKHGLHLIFMYLNSIPGHSWYVFGTLLAGGVVGTFTIWLIKYVHKAKSLEAPAKHVIAYLLGLISSLGAIATYYITHSSDFPAFFGSAAPTIFAIATVVHQLTDSATYKKVSTALQHIVGQKNALKDELSAPAEPTTAEINAESAAVHDSNVKNNPRNLFS